ncbi:Vegetative incompatibility protein HET-E-1 [Fulvia fulva]|uniref:Vegetative incompatibility protein HET-E-1 n=1 Tax=Passalora fulva TaxID=5499 RepID=A0A9Q8LDM9_PASFU|nr:Vegetative incompatibility protein HET-E-1 [Fulvia fulva]KAK4628940.1 Vegetative incompatibility protein HET-E-1 [Fulvia fulva]KAK4629885.1 Vegetative incompatibility protein HET-E-1 [Fulvia fulva]UJO15469.1 Vegetative incompatibility protein HET-E-1 [Fulvia fulva]WPV13069.1 Vegetative incompatibility protein HET-E-1 [Fulvia fulva]WPV27742.1 Vegetative incompatibility protein HET-E-1 [Fulvia fulva]
MRLLNTKTYRATRYRICAQDHRKRGQVAGPGHRKIIKACDFARSRKAKWIWIDTCCIDKKSSQELSEAINSMYDWYKGAAECYAYLADVPATRGRWTDEILSDFKRSVWFTRGWTLQELIAPLFVVFCDSAWEIIGVKESANNILLSQPGSIGPLGTLNAVLSQITGIPELVLGDATERSRYSVAQKMNWAADGQNTRAEDTAYCLLGIFSINMPLLYGEREKAFVRLQREIMNSTLDESLLAWRTEEAYDLVPSPAFDSLTSNKRYLALLATSPAAFKHCQNVSRHRIGIAGAPRFLLAAAGLIQFCPDERSMIYQIEKKTYAIVLGCTYRTPSTNSDEWERDACCLVVSAVACGHLRRVHLAGSVQDNPLLFPKITPTHTMRLYLHSVEKDADQC